MDAHPPAPCPQWGAVLVWWGQDVGHSHSFPAQKGGLCPFPTASILTAPTLQPPPYSPHPIAPCPYSAPGWCPSPMVSTVVPPPPPLQPSGPHQDPLGWMECVGPNWDGTRPRCGDRAARAGGGGGQGGLTPSGGGAALTHAIVHTCTHARGRGTPRACAGPPPMAMGSGPHGTGGRGAPRGRPPSPPLPPPAAPRCPHCPPAAPMGSHSPSGIWGVRAPRVPQPRGEGSPISVLPTPQPGAPPARRARALRPPEELGDGEHRLRHAVRPGRAGGGGEGGCGAAHRAGCGAPHGCQPRGCPQELPCSSRRCLGSLVLPKQLPVPGAEGGRSGAELLALARDFIDQYYASIRR